MFITLNHASAALCKTINGTPFSASKAVANTFFLALQACQESGANGIVQYSGYNVSTAFSVRDYPVRGAANSAGLEARQLSLYDAAGAAEFVLETPFPVSNREMVPLSVTRRKNFQGVTRYSNSRAKTLAPTMRSVAEDYDIDPLLLHAIAHVESRHDPRAVSPAGALGLMQVMPATARRFGVSDPEQQLYDPLVNLKVSSTYLKKLQRLFGGDLHLILAAYNAGENAVIKYGREIPPYRETQAYVRNVMDHYMKLRGER